MNTELQQMVNALVNGEQDKAKEHLSAYFNQAAAKIVNEAQSHYAYDVYKGKKLIDTVFYNYEEDVNQVKKSLVDHDGYDSDIVVRKAKK